jgi:hypothetical protein
VECKSDKLLKRALTSLKGKVWSKMKLHRLAIYVKDRQSTIFLKAHSNFVIFSVCRLNFEKVKIEGGKQMFQITLK